MDLQDYSGWDEFDVDEYVSRCYGRGVMEVDREIISGVIDTFMELGLGPNSFRCVADVGAGPNLFPAMLMAPLVRHKSEGGSLELIEISKPARSYLRNATSSAPEESLLQTWQEFEDCMKQKFTLWNDCYQACREAAEVVEGDIFDLAADRYDAISSFFVTESITNSRERCEQAIARLIAAVKPGGLVMVGHMLNSHGWYAGEATRFPAVAISGEEFERIYAERLDVVAVIRPAMGEFVRRDYEGAIVIIGQKKAKSRAGRMFTPYDIQNCFYDEGRVAYFQKAISETVVPGAVVVDGGSGTGILGLLAAAAGAKHVYCIEESAEYCEVIRRNADNNGFGHVISVICGDATTVELPELVDVVIAEVISGGLFYEPQLQILENLRRFLKKGGELIPRAMSNYLTLMRAQDELYGLKFNYDTRFRVLDDREMSTTEVYLDLDFAGTNETSIIGVVHLKATQSGEVNSIRISYTLTLSKSFEAREKTEFFLCPQIIFLPHPIAVEAGRVYRVQISYEAADSPLSCAIVVD